MGVYVGRVRVLHRVPLPTGVGKFQSVGECEIVCLAGLHTDRRPGDLPAPEFVQGEGYSCPVMIYPRVHKPSLFLWVRSIMRQMSGQTLLKY